MTRLPVRHLSRLHYLHAEHCAALSLLLPLLLLLSAVISVATTAPRASPVSANAAVSWSLLSPPAAASSPSPPARIDAAAVATPASLIISHGRRLGGSEDAACCLSDSWQFLFASAEWRQLHPACTDRQQAAGACPSARFGAAAAWDGQWMFLSGGDDGGRSRGHSSGSSHNIFSDLWRLPAAEQQTEPHARWQRLHAAVSDGSLSAAGLLSSSMLASASPRSLPHAQHTALLLSDGALLVFGGLRPRAEAEQADGSGGDSVAASNQLWLLPIARQLHGEESVSDWLLMQCETAAAPPARFGHAMAAVESTSSSSLRLFVYGGSRLFESELSDLWTATLRLGPSPSCSWQLLSPSTGGLPGTAPAGRSSASLAANERFLLLLHSCKCSEAVCVQALETAAFDLRKLTWSAQAGAAAAPQPRSAAESPCGQTAIAAVSAKAQEDDGLLEMIVLRASAVATVSEVEVRLLSYRLWREGELEEAQAARTEAWELSAVRLVCYVTPAFAILMLLCRYRKSLWRDRKLH